MVIPLARFIVCSVILSRLSLVLVLAAVRLLHLLLKDLKILLGVLDLSDLCVTIKIFGKLHKKLLGM